MASFIYFSVKATNYLKYFQSGTHIFLEWMHKLQKNKNHSLHICLSYANTLSEIFNKFKVCNDICFFFINCMICKNCKLI